MPGRHRADRRRRAGRQLIDQFLFDATGAMVETRVSTPVSSPSEIATTPHEHRRADPRRIHSPAPSERFIAVNTRPPISSATASEVAAPAA